MNVELRSYANGFILQWVETKNGERRNKRILYQTDWDFPSLATALNLKFARCSCGRSDGTVDCEYCRVTATESIMSAADALYRRIGIARASKAVKQALEELSEVAQTQMTKAEWKEADWRRAFTKDNSAPEYDAEAAWLG